MAFVKQALARLQAGELAEAENICRAVLEDIGQHPDALHILGMVAHQRGHAREALAFMKDAVNADPRNGDRRLELGLLAYEVGADYDAVAHLEALIAGCGDVPPALNCLGNALCRLGHPEAAIDRLERAVASAPRWPKAWLDLANAYRKVGRPLAAARALESAYRQAPDPKILLALGETLLEAGNLQRAVTFFRQLVRQDDSQAGAWLQLGNALRKLGDIDRALDAHREAIRADHDDPHAQLELARTELLAGKLSDGLPRLAFRKLLPDRQTLGQAWDEGDPGDRELTVCADEDPGEAIVLCRFVGAMTKRVKRVRLAVPSELLALFGECWVDAERVGLCSLADVQPEATTVGLVELPRILNVRDKVTASGPYLRTRAASTEARGGQGLPTDLRVGIRLTTEGEPRHHERGDEPQPAITPRDGAVLVELNPQGAASPDPVLSLAQQIAGCDVVITDDALTAHLAGAMDKSIWLLVAHDEGPYFGRDGNGFYRGMRTFRTGSGAEYRVAMEAINSALDQETMETQRCNVPSPLETGG